MTPRHVRRLGIFVVIASLVVQLGAIGAAGAGPLEDKQAEAARVQQQLDQQAQRAEALDEQYNRSQLSLQKVEANVAKASAAAQQAEQRLGQTRDRVRQFAVDAYVHGGSAPAIVELSGSDGRDLPVRTAYIDATTAKSREAIEALQNARVDLAQQRSDLERQRQAAKAQSDQLAQARGAAEQAAAAQQAMLDGLNGDIAQLVAQRQAEEQAAAARRAAAELAARQAQDAAIQAAAARRAQAEPSRSAAPKPSGTSGGSSSGSSSSGSSASPPPSSSPPPPSGHGAAAAIAEARRQLGKPYQWGAAGPDSFDCSGLTMWAWRAGGVSLSHSTYAQWDETTHIPISQMQPGDLIFYGSDLHHVAMYTGGGMMIEAPHTGANVREVAVRYDGIQGIGRVG